MRSRTSNEGRRVSDGHRAVAGDGQQLLCRHGDAVAVQTVMEGADGEAEEVQLPVGQTLTEDCRPQHQPIRTQEAQVTHRSANQITANSTYSEYLCNPLFHGLDFKLICF